VTVAGSTVWATTEPGETHLTYPISEEPPGCIQRDGEPAYIVGYEESSVWYRWTPTTVGTYDIDLTSPEWGGGIAAFVASNQAAGIDDLAGALVACGQELEPGGAATTIGVDDPSASYYIQVSGDGVDSDRDVSPDQAQAANGAFTLGIARQAG